MTIIKTISFGGLGDAFIVGCKLDQFYTKLLKKDSGAKIEHLFVESSEKTCSLIREYVEAFWNSSRFNFNVECDPDYQNNWYAGKWKDRKYFNTTWHGVYRFPGNDTESLETTFATLRTKKDPKYDVCIQVAAGANSTRSWKFDVIRLRNILKAYGLKVALVGTAEKFVDEDPFNFVCKTNLKESIDRVSESKLYIGLSGFHTYHSLARGIPNIHCMESQQHNFHYIHPSWEPYRFEVKHATLSEVFDGLKHWKVYP